MRALRQKWVQMRCRLCPPCTGRPFVPHLNIRSPKLIKNFPLAYCREPIRNTSHNEAILHLRCRCCPSCVSTKQDTHCRLLLTLSDVPCFSLTAEWSDYLTTAAAAPAPPLFRLIKLEDGSVAYAARESGPVHPNTAQPLDEVELRTGPAEAGLTEQQKTPVDVELRRARARDKYKQTQESKGLLVRPYAPRKKVAERRFVEAKTPPTDVSLDPSGRLPDLQANTAGSTVASPVRTQEAAGPPPGSIDDEAWIEDILSTHIDSDLFKDLPFLQ